MRIINYNNEGAGIKSPPPEAEKLARVVENRASELRRLKAEERRLASQVHNNSSRAVTKQTSATLPRTPQCKPLKVSSQSPKHVNESIQKKMETFGEKPEKGIKALFAAAKTISSNSLDIKLNVDNVKKFNEVEANRGAKKSTASSSLDIKLNENNVKKFNEVEANRGAKNRTASSSLDIKLNENNVKKFNKATANQGIKKISEKYNTPEAKNPVKKLEPKKIPNVKKKVQVDESSSENVLPVKSAIAVYERKGDDQKVFSKPPLKEMKREENSQVFSNGIKCPANGFSLVSSTKTSSLPTENDVVIVDTTKTKQMNDPAKNVQQYKPVLIVKPSMSKNLKSQAIIDEDAKESKRLVADSAKFIEQSGNEAEAVIETRDHKEEQSAKARPISGVEIISDAEKAAVLAVSFPVILDLVRSGGTRLWRDIPGVKESNIVERISKEEWLRQEAKFEVLVSEASFCNGLNSLKTFYMHHIQKSINQKMITQRDFDTLFSSIDEVYNCSKAFLSELEEDWQKDMMLGGIYDIVIRHTTSHFKPYIKYCSNVPDITKHLHQLTNDKNNTNFKDLLNFLVNRSEERLTLDAFLLTPMQRITKLPLLMSAIKDRLEEGSTEFKQCQEAHEATTKITKECNEAAKQKERMEALLKVNNEIEFHEDTNKIPIIIPNRVVVSRANVKHFTFGEKATHESLHLILFSDLLLVTKRKSEKLYTVMDFCKPDTIKIEELESQTFTSTYNKKQRSLVCISMVSGTKNKKSDLVVTFKEQKDNKEWIDMFAKDTTVSNEVHVIARLSYEPVGSDELKFSAGEVIRMLDDPVDGWATGKVLSDGRQGRFLVDKTVVVKQVDKDIKSSSERNSHPQDILKMLHEEEIS